MPWGRALRGRRFGRVARRHARRAPRRRPAQGAERPVLAQVVALSVVAYDLVGLIARKLAGVGGPSFGEYVLAGALPDALLNAVLAFLLGGWLLGMVRTKPYDWEER